MSPLATRVFTRTALCFLSLVAFAAGASAQTPRLYVNAFAPNEDHRNTR
jgi:hypothetical protein